MIKSKLFPTTNLETPCTQPESVRCREAVRRERHRMAADLHDSLAQGLNAIVLQLQAAEEELSENSGESLRHIRRARDVARQTLAFARSTMWTLCDEPQAHRDGDEHTQSLAPALSLMAHQLFATGPIKLKCSLEQPGCAMPAHMKVDLLRISKEALANVLKHAGATAVHIRLLYRNGQVQLSVEDNGRGFVNGPSSRLHRSFGLSSMRERARRLGGTVIVKSQPGSGTRVTVLVPLAADSAESLAA